ncbi:hypothetical protein [Acinetobacter guillouiae]|uniref:hypothetical protein n=1 Tax=Acinetobacter guillouiae TaxID=106649 RepID=UPI003AF73A48
MNIEDALKEARKIKIPKKTADEVKRELEQKVDWAKKGNFREVIISVPIYFNEDEITYLYEDYHNSGYGMYVLQAESNIFMKISW